MAVIKKPYEISVWEEHLNDLGIKTEHRLATIGSDTMNYLGKATSITLKKELKGTNVLTFKMPTKFYDSQLGKYVKNEFIDMLYNEQKIKLFFNEQWLEFYVKQISEEKQFKAIMKTYVCNDSFIDELSRTGYGIIFDEELYNNVDELGNFMEIILEDSVWDYRPDLNTGDFTEFKEERFYKIPLSQFGGIIKAYPIELKVNPIDFNTESNYYKEVVEEQGSFNAESEAKIENIFLNKERQLELGDDLSREKEIFWDNYYKDNGFKLLNDNNMVELSGDYIYVPYSCLSFIYGNVYTNAYRATEEPAIYGSYENGNKYGYALQPSSKNPTDLIQFIFFNEGDKVLVDEEGTVVNNNYHYVIKISQWNELLKKQLKDKETLIYWATSDIPEQSKLTTKYELKKDGDIIYSINVKPDTRTIDDFEWYPVYYEGYMEQLGDQEVFAARKISITDRTEYNLKSGYYCTVYNNQDKEYLGLYSEPEIEILIKQDENEFRVVSHEETRIILPTLAKNLIQNGEKITDEIGWEALTQNDTSEYNTGSYANLLDIEIKSTNEELQSGVTTGWSTDEIVSDYYLELLSPNIMKCNDMSLEGTVSTDYALNFGLSSADIQIEKDKVYAIRICSGKWIIEDYTIILRNSEIEFDGVGVNEAAADKYKNALKEYCLFLCTESLEGLSLENTKGEIQQFLLDKIQNHDSSIDDVLSKWESCMTTGDYKYLIGRLKEIKEENSKEDDNENKEENDSNEGIEPYDDGNKELPEDDNEEKPEEGEQEEIEVLDEYLLISQDDYIAWIDRAIIENKIFFKSYNTDLDKIIIGEGSIDIDGNYTLSGVTSTKDADKFISFADIFEAITDEGGNELTFIPQSDEIFNQEKSPLIRTLYYEKENNKWVWKEEKVNEISVADNAYLLFKAKANIVSPYVGIKVDSEPMTVTIESTKSYNYGETDYSGVKLETYAESKDDNLDYLVDGANIKIYKVDNNNFSDEFLINVGWRLEEKQISSSTTGDFSNDNFNYGESFSHGIDVSYAQGMVDWETVKNSGKIDFAILRIGYGDNDIDSQFERNYQECKKYNIPVGGYWYCYNNTIEGAKKEAQKCLEIIKGKVFEYPIYYDIEEASTLNAANQIAPAFCEVLANAGIYVGIYSFASALENQFSQEVINKYPVWVAQFGTTPGDVPAYNGHFEIHQYSSTGSITGISGNVDLNECYKNYPAIIGGKQEDNSNKKNLTIQAQDEEESTPPSEGMAFVKTYDRGTYYCYGEPRMGGSGRDLIDCSVGEGNIRGSIASRDLYEKYGYNYNNERTKVYLIIREYPEMNGYYYLDDSNAAGVLNVIDFFYIYGSSCPFQQAGVVTVDCYMGEMIEEEPTKPPSQSSSSAAQDKINRENPNNDYTLRDGYLLSTAKPVWTGTSSSEVPLFFNALLPKGGDSCSMAYALFINDYYYGIFWLNSPTIYATGVSNNGSNSSDNSNINYGGTAIGEISNLLNISYTFEYEGSSYDITITQDIVDLYQALSGAGLSIAACCGGLGNFRIECGENIRATAELGPAAGGDGGDAGGLMQWNPYSKHLNWARENGYGDDPWSWQANIGHAIDDITGKHCSPSIWRVQESSMESYGYTPVASIEEYFAITNPIDAAVNFERLYEGSADWANSRCLQRRAYAQGYYSIIYEGKKN